MELKYRGIKYSTAEAQAKEMPTEAISLKFMGQSYITYDHSLPIQQKPCQAATLQFHGTFYSHLLC